MGASRGLGRPLAHTAYSSTTTSTPPRSLVGLELNVDFDAHNQFNSAEPQDATGRGCDDDSDDCNWWCSTEAVAPTTPLSDAPR